MPNWCHSRLTVFGPVEQVSAFVKKARGPTQEYFVSPEERALLAKIQGEALDVRERVEVFSFHQLVPIPDAILAGPYDPAGYNAEVSLWGIKWGASETLLRSHKPGVAVYTYDTPWGIGATFFETVSAQWPDLTFAVSYNEESPQRGRFIAKGGALARIVYDDHATAPSLHENATPAEEKRYEYLYEDWLNEYIKSHDEWVATGCSADGPLLWMTGAQPVPSP